MMNTKNFSAIGLATAALLTLSACDSNDEAQPSDTETVTVTAEAKDSSSEASSSKSASSSPAAYSDSDSGMISAIDAVTEKYSDAKIMSISSEDDSSHWEVDALKSEEHLELLVNEEEVLTEESEQENSNDDDVRDINEATVDIKKAVETAEKEKGSPATQAELDRLTRSDNQLVWEVEFEGEGKDNKVLVDAKSGDIVTQ